MRSTVVTASAVLLSLGAQLAPAAPGDVFLLQIPGVNGGSTLRAFPGWITLNSFSAGFTTPIDLTTGQASGRLTCKQVMAIKPLDTTSPELAMSVATGHHYATLQLVALNGATGHEFLRLKLSSAVLSSLLLGGDTAAASRTESLAIAAQQIEVTSTPVSADGLPGQPVTATVFCNGGLT